MSEIPDSAPIFEEPPRREYGTFCVHARYKVVSEQRKITCRDCGGDLDAFDIVLRVAYRQATREDIEQAIRDKRVELARLTAEEKRVKARVRNANKKDADAAVAKALAKRDDNHSSNVFGLLMAIDEIKAALKRMGHDV